MLQGGPSHIFSHQHQYNPQGEPAWMISQHAQQQHAQQQAAQAAYNRITASHTNNAMGPSVNSALNQQDGNMGNDTVSEENRRTLAFIADLLNEETREAALLELSKKREQVPELALILWHSFGKCRPAFWKFILLTKYRCYDFSFARNHICVYPPQPIAAYSCCIKSRM